MPRASGADRLVVDRHVFTASDACSSEPAASLSGARRVVDVLCLAVPRGMRRGSIDDRQLGVGPDVLHHPLDPGASTDSVEKDLADLLGVEWAEARVHQESHPGETALGLLVDELIVG
jgi:hypothetical protein